MTAPADKETPIKILEIVKPILKKSRSTENRKQFACVLTSLDNVYKKTIDSKLVKRAAKNRKLA